MSNVPMIVEKDGKRERSWDVYSRLFKDRIIFLDTDFNDNMASAICAQLLLLEMEDSKADIILYINSPGGSVSSGLAIIDTMNYIKCDVSTVVLGMAASMASITASSGAKGKRYMLPHARNMVHQVSSGARGQVADMKIALAEADRLNTELRNMYIVTNSSGKTVEDMKKAMDRDTWLTAKEAVKFGVCDKIIHRK